MVPDLMIMGVGSGRVGSSGILSAVPVRFVCVQAICEKRHGYVRLGTISFIYCCCIP